MSDTPSTPSASSHVASQANVSPHAKVVTFPKLTRTLNLLLEQSVFTRFGSEEPVLCIGSAEKCTELAIQLERQGLLEGKIVQVGEEQRLSESARASFIADVPQKQIWHGIALSEREASTLQKKLSETYGVNVPFVNGRLHDYAAFTQAVHDACHRETGHGITP